MLKSYYYIILSIGITFTTVLDLSAQAAKTHTVQAGETLYGIARNHQIHINELLKANPQIQNNAIKPGDIVHIPAAGAPVSTPVLPSTVPASKVPAQQNNTSAQPFGGATGVAEPAKNIPQTVPSTTAPSIKNNQLPMIEHVVQEKQTLYAISKLYNVTVDEIKAWNHLADNGIKVGSVLYIHTSKPAETLANTQTVLTTTAPVVHTPAPVVNKEETVPAAPVKTEPKPVETKPSAPVLPTPVKETPVAKSNSPQGQLEEAYVSAKNSGKSLQSSRGTITWIATENAKMSDSFFALHKTAPVGTIVKITNLVNKRVVFVKVIGKLPDTSDNLNITLRLSSAAKNALLLNGDKAYVDMDFYQ